MNEVELGSDVSLFDNDISWKEELDSNESGETRNLVMVILVDEANMFDRRFHLKHFHLIDEVLV